MKSIFRIAALLIVIMLPAIQAKADVEIKWLETEHNFGAFDEDDGPVTCNFRFVNTGEEPVIVRSVRTSCGCTTSKPPRKPIEPGDTASISATYNPAGRPGKFDKRIFVDMNTNPSRAELLIKGTVIGASNTIRSRYPIDGGSLKVRSTRMAFGDVKRGHVANEFYEVYNASHDTLTPAWTELPPYVRSVSKTMEIAPGELMSYALIFDASYPSEEPPYGIVTDSISLIAREGEAPIRIGLTANVLEDFSRMTPKQRAEAPAMHLSEDGIIDFGSFSKTGSAVRTIKISNTGKSPLLLRRVYTIDPGVNATVDREKIKPGKEATVTITIDPSELKSGLLNARLCIISNDPDNPVATLRLSGIPQ